MEKLHRDGQLQFFGDHEPLADAATFGRWLSPLRTCEWVVYAKRPFAGPEEVVPGVSVALYPPGGNLEPAPGFHKNADGVTFRWKDYRAKGRTRHKTMLLSADEFMRRFLLHVLPSGFHRIRHYGLLANAERRASLTKARALLDVPPPEPIYDDSTLAPVPTFVCRCCGATMRVVEIIVRGRPIRAPP